MKQSLVAIEGMLAHLMGNGSGFLHSVNGAQQVYIPSRLIEELNVLPGDEMKCWCLYNDPEHAHTAEYKAIRVLVTKRIDESMAPANRAQSAPMPKPKEEAAPALARTGGPFDALADIPLPPKVVAPLRPAKPTAKAAPPAPAEPPQKAPDTPAHTEVAKPATAPEGASPEAPAATIPVPPPRASDTSLSLDELYGMMDEIMSAPRLLTAKDVYMEVCRRDPRQWKDDKLQWRITHALNAMAEKGHVATAKLFSSTEQTNASAVYYARNLDLMTMLMRGEMK